MKSYRIALIACPLMLLMAGAAQRPAASPAQGGVADAPPAMLDGLAKGLWKLRGIGGAPSSVGASSLCLGDPMQLAQIQHLGEDCSHYIVRSTPNLVTVSYSCPGEGQGLTTIRRETDRLIQIRSQGIRNNNPFSFAVEGRHAGKC